MATPDASTTSSTPEELLQALLSQALRALGHPRRPRNSVHFSDQMVALSHETAREPGTDGGRSDEAGKPFVEVSGRKGLGVKMDDLLDLLTEKAAAEVAKRNPDVFTANKCGRVAAQIAVSAIRYFIMKFSRGKLIVFDIAEAISFEGETGPYLQYAVVRANNIFLKLKEREGITEADVRGGGSTSPATDELTTPTTLLGAPALKRPAWMKSSSRWSDCSSSRRSPGTRSASPSFSTPSTIAFLFLNEEQAGSGSAGAPPAVVVLSL